MRHQDSGSWLEGLLGDPALPGPPSVLIESHVIGGEGNRTTGWDPPPPPGRLLPIGGAFPPNPLMTHPRNTDWEVRGDVLVPVGI